jgi:hypothetical protein
MKKQLLIVSAFALSVTAFAQPSLSSTNSNPVIGDQFTLIPGSWISEGSAGANQTWNFSSVTTTVSSATGYTAQAVSGSNATAFPNANVQLAGAGGTSFLKTSSAALQNFGTATGTVQIKYSDAEDQMRYPCAMGNTYTDPHAATFTSAGYNYTRKGTTTITADAYGTLQLPGGTYSNVLRVHMIQAYRDSTNFGGSFPYTLDYYNSQYLWYVPNNHMPIFSTYSLSVNGGTATKGSTTLQSITNSIGELEAGIKSMNLYPNPANGEFINMDLNLEKNISYSIVITDNLGREVMNTESLKGMEGYNFRSINISGIESGLYQVVLKSEGQLLKTTKIVVVR